jgi:hypothetical protein
MDIIIGLSIIAHTSITDLENMPLSELFGYKSRVEKIIKESGKPGR